MTNPTPDQTIRTVQELLRQGQTPRAIAARLGITTQAVYLHMATLRRMQEAKEKRGA